MALSRKKEQDRIQSGLSTQELRDQYSAMSRLLLERRNEIVGRFANTRANLEQQVMAGPGDVGDASVVDTNADYFLTLADSQRGELLAIRDALDRMHRGVYGVCQSCRNSIAVERLEKLPFARLCIDCQSEYEASNRSARLHSMSKI